MKTRFVPLVLLTSMFAGCSGTDPSDPEVGARVQAISSHPPRLFLSSTVLSRLQTRAAAADAEWLALRAHCDGWATGTVYPPSGPVSVAYPNIAQGAAGTDYFTAVVSLGLCYRMVEGVDSSRQSTYGAAGGRVLTAMSTPAASGGTQPSTDDGYDIRNYGVGMALGFDWLYPALSSTLKQQVVSTLNAWIDWYDTSGFERGSPIGNYFAGYLLAKTTGALSTDGDNANSTTYWNDVQNRLWPNLVKPAYTLSMKGGGWPEGWEYGPKSVVEMAEFLWAVETAKGLNWASQLPYSFWHDEMVYQNYFAWPSLKHMDDQGAIHSGYPMNPQTYNLMALSMIMQVHGDSAAPVARGFTADAMAQNHDPVDLWESFMFWDPSLSQNPYTNQPLSYFATGPGHVAVRSSWDKTAIWGTLVGGPYIDATESGEQFFNEGSVAVVQGDQPLLVNATGWLPQVSGNDGETYVYNDEWTNKTRVLYNTFFVNDSNNLYNPGQGQTTPASAATHIERYEDQGGYVRARAARVEDMYVEKVGGSYKPITQFMRDLVYLRPNIFVIYDRTTATEGGDDQWLSFHFPAHPNAVTTADTTQRRYDLQLSGATAGSLRTLLPKNASTSVVDLPFTTVYRVEDHIATHAASQDWLSVFTAGGTIPEHVRLSPGDGNVLSGQMNGVHLQGTRNQVVLLSNDHAGVATASTVKYVVAQTADADHVLIDMAPSGTGYGVTATSASGKLTINVQQGGSYAVTSAGSVSFSVTKAGAVGPPGWVGGPPPPPPPPAPAPPPPPPPGNLLQNPSLDTWSAGLPASWTKAGSGTITETTSGVENGTAAAQVASVAFGNGLSQSVSFSPAKASGTVLTGQAYFKYVSGDTTAPLIQMAVTYADGTATQYVNQSVQGWAPTGAWIQGTATLTTAHPVSSVLFRALSNTGTAQIYQLDNANFTAP